MSAVTGISLPTRAARVDTVESPAKGTLARDRLDQTERQCVDVGLRVDLHAERLLG